MTPAHNPFHLGMPGVSYDDNLILRAFFFHNIVNSFYERTGCIHTLQPVLLNQIINPGRNAVRADYHCSLFDTGKLVFVMNHFYAPLLQISYHLFIMYDWPVSIYFSAGFNLLIHLFNRPFYSETKAGAFCKFYFHLHPPGIPQASASAFTSASGLPLPFLTLLFLYDSPVCINPKLPSQPRRLSYPRNPQARRPLPV